MSDAITGSIENGRRATAAPPFYTGEVGVRQRGDTLELAWFGRPPAFTEPTRGTLDDKPILVTSIRCRDLSQAQPLRQRAARDQAIIATAEPVGLN